MLAQTAALLKETEREGGRGRETIGIAIDLADCVVGMSPLPPACLPACLPASPLNWGSDGGGSIRLQSSSGRTGGQRERERGTEKGISSPLINHGRVSKQTEKLRCRDGMLCLRRRHPPNLSNALLMAGQTAEMMSL